jgi:glycosyltransferase involved in cell wall biosynthesis
MKGRTKATRSSLRGHMREAAKQGNAEPAPAVSAVIPTYNRAAFVPRAIQSVLRQTFCDLEVIVVDDGSPEATQDAVARFDDSRLRYIRLPKNMGQWHAENVGIAHARGEWVAFLDDDDEWAPEKLAKLLERANAIGASAAYSRKLRIGYEGPILPKRDRPLPEGDVSTSVLTLLMPATPSAFMVRRDALISVGGFDESLPQAQDVDLWVRLSLAGYRFAAVDERLALYHEDHPNRQMDDPLLLARSTSVHARRWGHLLREAMADPETGAWVTRCEEKSRKGVAKRVNRFVRSIERSGSRSEAWWYVRRMTRVLPWGAAFYARMTAVIVFGRLPHRFSQLRKGKTGAPWLRRLLGAG